MSTYIPSIAIHRNETPCWFYLRRAEGLPKLTIFIIWWEVMVWWE